MTDCNANELPARIAAEPCGMDIIHRDELKMIIRRDLFPEIWVMDGPDIVEYIKAGLIGKTLLIVQHEGLPTLIPAEMATDKKCNAGMTIQSIAFQQMASSTSRAAESIKALNDTVELYDRKTRLDNIPITTAIHPKFAPKFQPFQKPRNTNKPPKKKKRK